MRVLLVAPPGAGKGTQAARMEARYGIRHISSGDLLRAEIAAGTDVGRVAKSFVDAGDLVPDDLIMSIVSGPVLEAVANGGYILDGYPRTVAQAEAAYVVAEPRGADAQVVLSFAVDDTELLRRMAARAAAEGRADDTDEVIRHRIEVYHSVTEPLLDHYDGRGIHHRIDATGTPDEVTAAVFAVLDPLR